MMGILKIAYKLLVNDKGKFAALLIGITFSVFLMIEMTSMFAGFMRKASSTVMNTGAKVWVMDRAVNNVLNSIPMPDYVLDAVRSIPGVRVCRSVLLRLRPGQAAQRGLPGGHRHRARRHQPAAAGRSLVEGQIEDIYAENGFVVIADEEMPKLENPTLGTEFEINDNRGVIVGIAKVPASGLFGMPTLYTTYRRAIQYLPTMRYTISYVLVEPASRAAIPRIKEDVALLGYDALTEDEFVASRSRSFYTCHTGLGTNILLMTAISFIVGLSISGQTFYSFTLENLEKFGALKAIGAKRRELVYMILFQVGAHRRRWLRARHRSVRAAHRPRQAAAARLRVGHHLRQPRPGARHGARDRRHLELHRRTQGAADRALRHLPELTVTAARDQSRWPVQVVRRGRDADLRRARGQLRGVLRRDALHRRPVGQRQDHAARASSPESCVPTRGTVRVERHRRLEPRREPTAPSSGSTPSASCSRTITSSRKLTTVENVAIPLILKRRDWSESILAAQHYLDIVGLKERANLPPTKLCGGEQQRVAIARAIVSGPDMLIFDEPTASLDGETGRKIIEFVRHEVLNDQRCILIVTHDERIYEFADRIVKMEDGRIVEIGKGAASA